jgi:hypothetical protein
LRWEYNLRKESKEGGQKPKKAFPREMDKIFPSFFLLSNPLFKPY